MNPTSHMELSLLQRAAGWLSCHRVEFVHHSNILIGVIVTPSRNIGTVCSAAAEAVIEHHSDRTSSDIPGLCSSSWSLNGLFRGTPDPEKRDLQHARRGRFGRDSGMCDCTPVGDSGVPWPLTA